MKFDNPTSLKLGMSGTIAGLRYRVVGRVVMGMEEAGQIYYWNEFNLVNDRGEFATLVFEETQYGAEWKMFTLFEPQNPMSVQEAATKRVGDTVNFEGAPLKVTLVDESTVNFIEGQAPEGVEVGDVAKYFNAEGGNKMQVASWTGNEIEFYRGINLPRGAVRDAFGLATDPTLNFRIAQGTYSPSFEWLPKVIGVVFVAIICFVIYSAWTPQSRQKGPVKIKLAEPSLVVGKTGKLRDATYRLQNHIAVEIAQVGKLYDQHEYNLAGDEGNALLIYGLKPGEKKWYLFKPVESVTPVSPFQAATNRVGDIVNVEGNPTKVTGLFQAKIQQAQGDESMGLTNGAVFYGFVAETPVYVLLAHWAETNIAFYRGQLLTEKSVMAALK